MVQLLQSEISKARIQHKDNYKELSRMVSANHTNMKSMYVLWSIFTQGEGLAGQEATAGEAAYRESAQSLPIDSRGPGERRSEESTS